MDRSSYPDVCSLSQRARLAIALRLFKGYCGRIGVHHPEIDRFLETWWDFVSFFGDGTQFGRWEKSQPPLIFTGLGDPCPTEVSEALEGAGVEQSEFLDALSCATEVAYTSMYGASDNEGSRRFLLELADIAVAHGVCWPDLAKFATSRWVDGHGWGGRPSEQELAVWRGD
jgi:hypothetical protein